MRRFCNGLTIYGLVIFGGLVLFWGLGELRQGSGDPSLAGLSTPAPITAVRFPVPPRPDDTPSAVDPPAPRSSSAKVAQRSEKRTARRTTPKADPNTVYKWVDEHGTVHFSDREGSPRAQQIAAVPVPTYDFPSTSGNHTEKETEQETEKVTEVLVDSIPIATAGFVPTQRFRNIKLANGLFLTGAGYRVDARAFHSGENLSFTGRVEGGAACDTLRLKGLLYSNAGEKISLFSYASGAGGGSTFFESETARVGANDQGWNLIAVEATCQDL